MRFLYALWRLSSWRGITTATPAAHGVTTSRPPNTAISGRTTSRPA